MIVWNDIHNYLSWVTINKCFMFECLKFMSCVGPVSIDCLLIDRQCHIVISCKHDAMLSLAYRSLFLDQSTWGITLVQRQANPPTSITWSRSQVTISDIQCVGLSLTGMTHTSSAFIQQDTMYSLNKLTTSILYPLFTCFKDADVAFSCSYLDLITEQTIFSQTSNASRTLHIILFPQRSLTYVPYNVGSYLR